MVDKLLSPSVFTVFLRGRHYYDSLGPCGCLLPLSSHLRAAAPELEDFPQKLSNFARNYIIVRSPWQTGLFFLSVIRRTCYPGNTFEIDFIACKGMGAYHKFFPSTICTLWISCPRRTRLWFTATVSEYIYMYCYDLLGDIVYCRFVILLSPLFF